MTRYEMPARSQGKLYAQRALAEMDCADVHRRVFAHGMDPETEPPVRKWLSRRLDGFYCDVQAMCTSHCVSGAGTHIVLQFPPPPMSTGVRDEIVSVSVRGLTARGAVKAIVEATGVACTPAPQMRDGRRKKGSEL